MANIGSLFVDLTMKTAGFNSSVDKAKKKVVSLRNSIKRDMKKIKATVKNAAKAFSTFAKVGVLAAGAAMGLIVTRSIEINDQMVKTADKLGIATDKLAGLRHAANITGVDAKALDKGLQTMQKTIADLSKGIGIAAKDYKRLGLSSKDLLSIPADEQFKLIAERLNKVQNATERVGIAYNIFGGRGTALVNTLALGRKGMEEMQAEAEALGLALTRVDAAKIEAAKDAITRSGEAFEGVGNKFTVAVAPFLVVFGNMITDRIKDANKMGGAVTTALSKISDAGAFVADALRGIEVVFKILNIAALSFVSLTLTAFDELQLGLVSVANALPGVDVKPSADLSKWAEESRGTVMALQDELIKLVEKPMPGENIKKMMQEIQKSAQAEAEKIAADAKTRGIGQVQTMGGDEEANQKKIDAKLAFFDRLKVLSQDQLLSEEENLTLKHEREIAKINTHHDALVELGMSKAEADAATKTALEDSEAVHWDKITKIREKAMTSSAKFTKMSFADQVKTVTSSLMQMTASASTQSRAMFEVNKAASIANAVVSGVQAVQDSYKFGASWGGPAAGATMAAIAAVATAANVQKIASTSFGGGGGGGVSAGGGGGGGGVPSLAATVGVPVTDTQQQATPQIVIHNTIQALDPSAVTPEVQQAMADSLASKIQDSLGRGLGGEVTV